MTSTHLNSRESVRSILKDSCKLCIQSWLAIFHHNLELQWLTYPVSSILGIALTNVEEWTSVLKLSTMWEFPETRTLAINRMSESGMMDLVTKVTLAKQYKVREWLFAAYDELVKRRENISDEEAGRLGLTTVVRLYRIREESMRKHLEWQSTFHEFGEVVQHDNRAKIWGEFSEELTKLGYTV